MEILSFAASAVLLSLLLLALDYAKDRGLFTASHQPLANKIIVITGAAGGLGRALALEFARRGAILALWDVRADALRDCVSWLIGECGVPPASVHSSVVDVADAGAIGAAARAQLAALGPAHVVVSNAAVVNGERLLDASEERLRASFAVNVLSHLWIARALLPQQRSSSSSSSDHGNGDGSSNHGSSSGVGGAGGGSNSATFVTIGSLMAEVPAARLGDYCASKAALLQLHECLRWELSGSEGSGVHCLHVQPHMIDTPLFNGGKPGRFGWVRALLPPLRATTVASRVVRAVETRRERIVVPYALKWLPPLLSLLPSALRDVALDLAGASCAMDAFEGAREGVFT